MHVSQDERKACFCLAEDIVVGRRDRDRGDLRERSGGEKGEIDSWREIRDSFMWGGLDACVEDEKNLLPERRGLIGGNEKQILREAGRKIGGRRGQRGGKTEREQQRGGGRLIHH